MRTVQRIVTGPHDPFGSRGDENASVTVTHESGDYTTPDGFHHVDGVHKVTAKYTLSGRGYVGRAYKGRARTFKGETAWMHAERLYSDIVTEIRLGR